MDDAAQRDVFCHYGEDFETWFGAQYGLTDFNNAYLQALLALFASVSGRQITFATLTAVDLAAIRWKYPAVDIFEPRRWISKGWC